MIPSDSYGAWMYAESSRDEAYVEIFDIRESGTFRYYTTTRKKCENGEYDERQEGTYTFAKGMFVFDLDGDVFAGRYADNTMIINNHRFEKISDYLVPSEPAKPSEDPDKPGNDPDDPNEDPEKPDDPDKPDTPIEDPESKVTVQTLGVEDVQPFFATLNSLIIGAGPKDETGFQIGFDPEFKIDTYRKESKKENSGHNRMRIKGLYSNQKYYYRAYAIVDRVEYYGNVREFVSEPFTYTINGCELRFITVEGGPYGDFCISQTEIPASAEFAVEDISFASTPLFILKKLTYANLHDFFSEINEKTGIQFRIPTTAEWQYAAQGGNKSKGFKYSGSNDVNKVAWHRLNSGGAAHEVAYKIPNELGLFDMSGNYSEFVTDEGINYLKNHTCYFHRGLEGLKVVYGGNFKSDPNECTPFSKMNAPQEESWALYDAETQAMRLVFSLDPAVIPFGNK